MLWSLHDEFFDYLVPLFKTVDLACGTGLSGEAFLDISLEMIGIDLSSLMINGADKKKIYSDMNLYVSEVSGFSEPVAYAIV